MSTSVVPIVLYRVAVWLHSSAGRGDLRAFGVSVGSPTVGYLLLRRAGQLPMQEHKAAHEAVRLRRHDVLSVKLPGSRILPRCSLPSCFVCSLWCLPRFVQGGFARVYEVKDVRGSRAACKVVTKSSLKTKKAKTKVRSCVYFRARSAAHCDMSSFTQKSRFTSHSTIRTSSAFKNALRTMITCT